MVRDEVAPVSAPVTSDREVVAGVTREAARRMPRPVEPMVLVAPTQLTAETRERFRDDALEMVARAADAQLSTVTIDLSQTCDVDASGLGVLVLAQRRAREHRISVSLVGVREPVKRLMELTRLDYLFHIAA